MGYVLVLLMVVAFGLIFVGFYEQLETLAFGGAIMLAVVMHRAGRSDAGR